jgi:hypothetical protein
MNDDFESLESELANLKPLALSPPLHDRIAKQLAAVPAARKDVWHLPLAIAVTISLAASLLVIFSPPKGAIDFAPPRDTSTPSTQVFAPSSPSVWSYHRALTLPEDALDSLLDQHAAARSGDGPPTHAAAFRTFTSVNQATLGDL